MKKLMSLILISILLVVFSTNVFAAESVLGDDDTNNVTTITGNEYNDAQNATGNKVDNGTNTNNTSLPQTGVEDYGTGILLVICVASAIFAYRKISDYRNI